MRRHRAVMSALALAAVVVAVIVLISSFVGDAADAQRDLGGSRADPVSDPRSDSAVVASNETERPGSPRTANTPDRSELQAVSTPINRRIALLLSAADAGDAWAACVGEAEISRCRKLLARDGSRAAYSLDRIARSGLDDAQLQEASQHLSLQLERVQQLRQACARLPLDTEQSVMRLRLQAAQAGDIESMRLFAEAEGVQDDLIASPEVYRLYRQYAWAMFLGAFHAGDPYALRLWLDASRSDSEVPLAGVVPAEWRDHSAATELASRVDANIYRGLDPDDPDYQRASDRAEALYWRYFANPKPRANSSQASDGSVPALATLTDIEQLTHFDILQRDESRCDLLR